MTRRRQLSLPPPPDSPVPKMVSSQDKVKPTRSGAKPRSREWLWRKGGGGILRKLRQNLAFRFPVTSLLLPSCHQGPESPVREHPSRPSLLRQHLWGGQSYCFSCRLPACHRDSSRGLLCHFFLGPAGKSGYLNIHRVSAEHTLHSASHVLPS